MKTRVKRMRFYLLTKAGKVRVDQYLESYVYFQDPENRAVGNALADHVSKAVLEFSERIEKDCIVGRETNSTLPVSLTRKKILES